MPTFGREDYPGGLDFARFLAGFIGRHPEWYGEFESARAREAAVEAPVAKEAEHGDVGMGDGAYELAEEVRDEEAEAEETEALLSDGEF